MLCCRISGFLCLHLLLLYVSYPTEIRVGRLIGQGGFSSVFTVQSIDASAEPPTHDDSPSSSNARTQQNQDNDNQEARQTFDYSQQVVIKRLRLDLADEEHAKGILDLALECEFLSVLSHQNIIQMVGYSNQDMYDDDFFVLLELLEVTLDRRFNSWRRTVESCSGVWIPLIGNCCVRNPQGLQRCWSQRWKAAESIAQALSYLHENRIVYRDLKPDNIGYTSSSDGGTLKLFDFGLAKRLDPADLVGDDKEFYRLTGNTGSLRYMAPEVACNDPYDERVDVYSFGILLWQICALTTPFMGMTAKSHAFQVVQQGYRPPLDGSWLNEWCELLEQCWRADARQRPTMEYVLEQCTSIVEELRSTNTGGVIVDGSATATEIV